VVINSQKVEVIIDTGAATNIITKALLKKLGLEIERESNARFKIANGAKAASLGEVDIEIEIDEWVIPTTLQVIDSIENDLLLGTAWLSLIKGKVDFQQKELTFEINDENGKIPIKYQKDDIENLEKYETENDENEYDEYDEFVEQEMYSMMIEKERCREQEVHTVITEKSDKEQKEQ